MTPDLTIIREVKPKKNKIWLITDTHLGHDKMVEYCGRPKNHSEIILKNLEVVKTGDTLIHLGDVCIGRDEHWHKELFLRLGFGISTFLLRGNHDKKSNQWYLEHGWDFVSESFSDHYFGQYITFSHIPIANVQNINIHGHFHNNLHRLQQKQWVTPDEEDRNMLLLSGMNENHKLLALENTNYKPVLLEAFLAGLLNPLT